MAQDNIPQAKREGKIIKEHRKAKNLNQEKLAELLDVSDRTVRVWEAGCASPTLVHKRALCDLLGIELEQFGLGPQKDYSLEEADERLKGALSFLDAGSFTSALSLSENL